MLLKEPCKASLHARASRIGQSAQLQHVATGLIAHRQRITPALPIMPPAFKVHAPHFVRLARPPAAGDAPSAGRPAQRPLFRQPATLQDPLETALARESAPCPIAANKSRAACAHPNGDAAPSS